MITNTVNRDKNPVHIISLLLHPLLIPTYTYLALNAQLSISELQIPAGMMWWLAGLIFLITFLLPAFIMVIMLKIKLITSLEMPVRSERNLPILITAVFFFLTYSILSRLAVAPLFYYFMLAVTALALVGFTINFAFSFKVSIHMIAIGGSAGAFIGMAFLLQTPLIESIIFSILLSGLVAYARLRLEVHSKGEVNTGFFTGLFFMLAVYFMLL
jgi:hypothetical protein